MIAHAKNGPENIAGYRPYDKSGGYWYDEDAADKAVDFFEEMLVHVKGDLAGQPLKLERWQFLKIPAAV